MKDTFVYYDTSQYYSYTWEYLGNGMAYCHNIRTHVDIKTGLPEFERTKLLTGELEFLRRLMFRAELSEVLK